LSATCLFCFFSRAAAKAQEHADAWDKAKLPNLAGPIEKVATDMRVMAESEGRCTCGDPVPKRSFKPRRRAL
jgi:hypothetical protein